MQAVVNGDGYQLVDVTSPVFYSLGELEEWVHDNIGEYEPIYYLTDR